MQGFVGGGGNRKIILAAMTSRDEASRAFRLRVLGQSVRLAAESAEGMAADGSGKGVS